MFKDLRVAGLGATASFQQTLGSMFNPKIIMENIENSRHPPIRDLLTGFQGVVRPGEMLCIYIFHHLGLNILIRTQWYLAALVLVVLLSLRP
jgi:ATP-binding cassette subfamily G (WHITE) protein 2 (SNQ2)